MTITIGVAGAGNIATSRHIPAFQAHDRVDVAAVYDTSNAKTRAVADEYDIQPKHSFTELCDAVDLISLCTPPSVHHDQTREALEAGCHVLCEKPMAMTETEATAMIEAAEKHDRVLSVVHNFLYMDAIERTRKRVENGSLGTITRTHMIKPESEQKRAKQYLDEADAPVDDTYDEWKLYRLFWDEAAHLMYLTQDILGEIELDTARATPTPISTYGTIRARFTAKNDAEGAITMLLDAPISEWWFIVVGTEGIALVDIYRDLAICFDREPDHSAGRVLNVLLSGLTQAGIGSVLSGMSLLKDRYADGYRIPDAGFSTQVDHLADAIEHGKPLPVPPTKDRNAVAAMEAVVETTPMQKGRAATSEPEGDSV